MPPPPNPPCLLWWVAGSAHTDGVIIIWILNPFEMASRPTIPSWLCIAVMLAWSDSRGQRFIAVSGGHQLCWLLINRCHTYVSCSVWLTCRADHFADTKACRADAASSPPSPAGAGATFASRPALSSCGRGKTEAV